MRPSRLPRFCSGDPKPPPGRTTPSPEVYGFEVQGLLRGASVKKKDIYRQELGAEIWNPNPELQTSPNTVVVKIDQVEELEPLHRRGPFWPLLEHLQPPFGGFRRV